MQSGGKMKAKFLIIIAVIGISLIMMTLVIPAYLYRQSDDLLTITYVCTTGLKPNAFSAYRVYDNGTHTINMDSCSWISNPNYKPASQEYQEIHGMSCSELIERHSIGEAYQNNENKVFAESKISNCNFIDDWSEAQEKVDDWR